MSQLLPLTGPPDWLLYGWFALGFLFLPAVGALLPVVVHRLSHRATAVTIIGAVTVAALVLWYELYAQTLESQEFLWFAAVLLGTYVSEAISLVLQGSERDDPRLSAAGAGLGVLLVAGLVVL